MDDDDTKVSRNCKVLNNHWACGRKVDAKSRIGRLSHILHSFLIRNYPRTVTTPCFSGDSGGQKGVLG